MEQSHLDAFDLVLENELVGGVEEEQLDTIRIIVDSGVADTDEGVVELGPFVVIRHAAAVVDEERSVVVREVVVDLGWTGTVEDFVVAFFCTNWRRWWDGIRVRLHEIDGCDEVVKHSSTGDLVCIGCILDEDLWRDNKKVKKGKIGRETYKVRVVVWDIWAASRRLATLSNSALVRVGQQI